MIILFSYSQNLICVFFLFKYFDVLLFCEDKLSFSFPLVATLVISFKSWRIEFHKSTVLLRPALLQANNGFIIYYYHLKPFIQSIHICLLESKNLMIHTL